MLFSILLAVGFASVVSLIGGVVLLKKHKGKFEEEQGLLISSFAAGALLATALLDLLRVDDRHLLVGDDGQE